MHWSSLQEIENRLKAENALNKSDRGYFVGKRSIGLWTKTPIFAQNRKFYTKPAF